MKRLILAALCVAAAASISFAQRSAQPTFSAYRSKVEPARAKAIDFRRSPGALMYRTRLREGLARGVNFAGRYILTGWGCGTGCTNGAIIDGRTGRVYFPDQLAGVAVWFGNTDEDFDTFEFKNDSRLLILRGTPGPMDDDLDVFDNAKQGTYYFEWLGTRFRLIKFVPQAPKTDVQ